MTKINCNIIKDLLPMYADDELSVESKTMVEEHLIECNDCKHLFDKMTSKVDIPIVDNSDDLKNFNKKRKIKKLLTVIISVVLTVAILVSGYILLFVKSYSVPTSRIKANMYISQIDKSSDLSYIYQNQQWTINIELVDNIFKSNLKVNVDDIIFESSDESGMPNGVTIKLSEVPIDFDRDNQEISIFDLGGTLGGLTTYNLSENPSDSSSSILKINYMYDMQRANEEPPEDYDYTVTIVYRDAVATYSMRDEGFFDA